MRDKLSQRPKVHVPRTHWDHAGEALAFAGMLLAVLLPIVLWADLPAQLPRHFLLSGEPTAWTGRWIAVVSAILALLCYVGLTLLARIPHYFNYPIEITEQNAPVQYRLARSMVIWLKTVIVWMFLYIQWSQTRVALGIDERMNPALMLSFLALIHVVMVLFVYRSYKSRDETTANDPYERIR